MLHSNYSCSSQAQLHVRVKQEEFLVYQHFWGWVSEISVLFCFFKEPTPLSIQSCPALCSPWIVAHQLLCPWDSPGKNTGVGCHALLQGIFPTQGSKLCLLYLLRWQVGSFLSKFPKWLWSSQLDSSLKTGIWKFMECSFFTLESYKISLSFPCPCCPKPFSLSKQMPTTKLVHPESLTMRQRYAPKSRKW